MRSVPIALNSGDPYHRGGDMRALCRPTGEAGLVTHVNMRGNVVNGNVGFFE